MRVKSSEPVSLRTSGAARIQMRRPLRLALEWTVTEGGRCPSKAPEMGSAHYHIAAGASKQNRRRAWNPHQQAHL